MRAAILILLAVALPAEDAAPTALKAEHAAVGVIVATPADWRPAPASGTALALESAHAGDDAAMRGAARLSLIVAPTTVADARAAADALARDLRRVGTAFDLRENAAVEIGGRAWHRQRLRFRTGQLGWEQLVLTAVDGGRVVHCVLSSDLARFAGHLPVFEGVAASLRWDPAAPLEEPEPEPEAEP